MFCVQGGGGGQGRREKTDEVRAQQGIALPAQQTKGCGLEVHRALPDAQPPHSQLTSFEALRTGLQLSQLHPLPTQKRQR